MDAVSIDAGYLVGIVSTLIVIIGVLGLAFVSYHFSVMKEQLKRIEENQIRFEDDTKGDIDNVHSRVSEHVERMHARPAQ